MFTTAQKRITAAVTTVFVTGAMLAVAATPAQAQEEYDPNHYPIVDGYVDWGVKESFRNYVTGPIAGGTITLSDGAAENGDGTFRFTEADGIYHIDTHNVEAAVAGSVLFEGHHGELQLELSNIEVTTDHAGETGFIIADVSSKSLSTGEVTGEQDVEFAALDLAGLSWERDEFTTMSVIPATLTEDGAGVFAGFYPAGTVLDPVTVAIQATQPTEPTDPDPTEPDPTEPTDPDPTDDTDAEGVLTAVDGLTDWGFKESFRNYVTGPIANGTITTEGLDQDSGDSYRFGLAEGTFDTESGAFDAAFNGSVNFSGHDGDLDLTLTDIELHGQDGELVLWANDVPFANVELDADLAVTEDRIAIADAPTTLTAEGADFMAGGPNGDGDRFYEAGEALDPVTVAVTFDEGADLDVNPPADSDNNGNDTASPNSPSVTTPKLPTTGAGLIWVIAAAAALLAAGAGAIVFTRRKAMPAI